MGRRFESDSRLSLFACKSERLSTGEMDGGFQGVTDELDSFELPLGESLSQSGGTINE